MTPRATSAGRCTRDAHAANRVHSVYYPDPRARCCSRGWGSGTPSSSAPEPRGHIGWVVFGSLTTGLIAALLLVAAPFVPAEEAAITGAVLCGFGLGWAMWAVLSARAFVLHRAVQVADRRRRRLL